MEVLNRKKFILELSKFKKKIENKSNKSLRRVTFALWQVTQTISPKRFGTFRANWNLRAGQIDGHYSLDKRIPNEPDVSDLRVGEKVYLANGLPYAWPLEAGSSDHAPQGITGPAKRIIEEAIAAGKFND